MLSKKMAFSLTSLITIFALFFVVTPAMAGEFGVTMRVHPGADVSTEDGAQVLREDITVLVRFDKIVKHGSGTGFDKSDITVIGYNKDGGARTVPAIPSVMVDSPNDGRNYWFVLPAPDNNTVRTFLYIPKHVVELVDPTAEIGDDGKRKAAGKNAAATLTVNYLDRDRGNPKVYSIKRADNSVVPVKAATVDVVITLSEQPKEFKKDHIDVSNATHGDPEAVTPIAEETVETLSRNVLTSSLTLTPPRGLYTPATPPEDNPDTPDVDESIGIHEAINGNTDYEDPGNTADPPVFTLPTAAPVAPATAGAPVDVPSKTLTVASTTTPVLPVGTDRTVEPTMPQVTDFQAAAAYEAAVQFYLALKAVNDAYKEELERHNAYMDAVRAEMEKDQAQNDRELQDHGITLQRATGRTTMLYPYVLTITPEYKKTDPIVVRVKSFEDVSGNKYMPEAVPGRNDVEGSNKLTIQVNEAKVNATTQIARALGIPIELPKDKVIPAGGYLIVAENIDASDIHVPPGKVDESPKAHERNTKERLYNVIVTDIPNLETHLSNGGIIDVVGPKDLIITEIMWGSDRSYDNPGKSQWIELYNAGAEYKTQDGDNTTILRFYDGTDTLPAMSTVHDRVGTTDALGLTWSLAGKGLSGRTAEKVAGTAATVAIPTEPLASMYRVITTAGTPANGREADSWKQSTLPSTNFESNRIGVHIGTPGAATVMSVAEKLALERAAEAKAAADAAAAKAAVTKTEATGTIPQNGNVYISEIMFDGGGRLPQWIEIANGSRSEEVNLSGWTITVDNATDDADVSVGTVTFTIPAGTTIGMFGQQEKPSTLLVVTEAARNDLGHRDGYLLNLWESNQDELILAGVSTRRYSLLSSEAFMITLAPPAPTKMKVAATATVSEKAAARAADARAMLKHEAASDMVGNLSAAGAAEWVLPTTTEGGRSSIIRTHLPITRGRGPAEPEDGDMMEGWVLAKDTSFAQPVHFRIISYYGAASDVGTPGFRAGGALPVELSHFSPARDRVTDAVVIKWSTESELNNAGFFIKRSQQRDGEFKVINTTMVPGAGTTSEKQFYTYKDTTAQPNVVYYYQIEDVSLDGQRQTLTRGIRLKGHVGAAGKVTTLWGELKTSHE